MYNGWLGSYPLFFYITPTRPPLPSPQLIKHKSQQYYAIHSIKKKEKAHTHMYDFINKKS